MANHEKILDNVPKILTEHESWNKKFKVEIRPSALPFCQIQYLFSKLDPIEISAGDSFMEKVFVSLGTTMHDLVQTYLGRAGLLYGMWKCKRCFWVSSPYLGTPFCGDKQLKWSRGKDLDGNPIGPEDGPCKGGYATRYEEFELKDPISGIKGHCDGLLIIASHLYLLEVKTKPSSSVVNKLEAPDDPHIAQATIYAEMCTPKKWGLDQEVEGIAYCYVPRDYPNKMRFIFHSRSDKSLNDVRMDVPEAKYMLVTGHNIEQAKAVCPDPKYAEKVKYCEYAAQCFRPDRAKFLRRLWDMNSENRESVTSFSEEWRFLSNFYEAEVEYEGIKYPSSEHAYQAAKTNVENQRLAISKLSSPGKAKRAGNSRKLELRSDWEEVKDKVMAKIVYRKFSSHENLRDMLLATGNLHLEEGNNWGDTYWGTVNGEGSNKLGKILMKVRSKLREKHGPSKQNKG